ncbi:HlyD family secretion protein [Paracoccus aminovorans]|uniref:HlyD family secretion protein n=1 Tax=Paracoccus aminovorans TaxID=34004 RepID=UPI0007845071|nr:HlyD family efflux transporter periplasmic adaptor subunit [Paracoccus aminovorans]MDQ7777751.1 HlyD family efflux transporter periplasmic adaptor subunit [Paracoccus aminovorans]
MKSNSRRWLLAAVAIIIVAGAWLAWQRLGAAGLPSGLAGGNGRIEAVEIDISTRTAGRLKEILADEGDFVEAGQPLARMDTVQLDSKRLQAEAELKRARIGVDTAKIQILQREAEREAAAAVVAQREAQLDAADRRLARSEQLARSNATSQQVLDDDRATRQGARAAVEAAKAQLAATEAGINAARAQVVDAEAAVGAAEAAVASIVSDIDDSTLTAPRAGRIQYRVAEPGEVLGAGGRVLSLVDVGNVHMTFFLPTSQAGRVALGSDVRIVLDAAPQYVIPARVSFVADVAQFTPKTVETEEERQKLMFRIKAKVSPELLGKHVQQVKTGLPGMAYVKIDPAAEWPTELAETVQ